MIRHLTPGQWGQIATWAVILGGGLIWLALLALAALHDHDAARRARTHDHETN